MKLEKVRIQNYRSIVDSGTVDIDDRVTVLIGKNEQGKTTFLKAITSASPRVTYGPSDLPNHMRPLLERQPSGEIPVLTIWLAPEPADQAALKTLVPEVERIHLLKVTKYYDGHRDFVRIDSSGVEEQVKFTPPAIDPIVGGIKNQMQTLGVKLAGHAKRQGEFAPHLPQALDIIKQFQTADFNNQDQIDNLVKAFAAGLTGVPAQDPPIQEDIAAAIKETQSISEKLVETLKSDKSKQLETFVPAFVFHSTTLDKIPNEVVIADFVKAPESTSKGMANLCGVAGLSMQKIRELAGSTDTPMREGFEDHFRARVSGGLNEFWTQETYTVHFRFDREKMSVSISDGTYERRIAPLDRSDGFQWYLSFYAALINEVSQTRPTVFLLDNPGLELHADGQRDIKRFLEEKLPANAQVIYVTHSPAMINPYDLEQIRQVELKGNMQGTRVGKLAFKEGSDFDLLEPVRSAIGASLATSLVFNQFNVLVEGAADKPILEGAFQTFHADERHKILVNGSVAESDEGFLVRFYQRANLPFVVYVDADSNGRDLKALLIRWGVPEDKIIDLAKIFEDKRGQDFELEDLLSIAFYDKAVKEAYPEASVQPPSANHAGKRTKYYEAEFRNSSGVKFSKRRVAEKVRGLINSGGIDDASKESLKRLTAAILAALRKQAGK